MTHYTHGGIPEDEALHWNAETYQRFGRIVLYLTSSGEHSRQKGYIDFHEMHRQFMRDEWNSKIADLDIFRASKNLPSISELVKKVSRELVDHGHALHADEQSPELPEFSEQNYTPPKNKPQTELAAAEVEQLSLF